LWNEGEGNIFFDRDRFAGRVSCDLPACLTPASGGDHQSAGLDFDRDFPKDDKLTNQQ
jgi:hypothetical protein